MLPWTASALLIGLLLGGLYVVVGDLGAPIAAHFVVNYLNLRYINAHDASELAPREDA
jgi:membrane protease YdiL (CAAX protease family)